MNLTLAELAQLPLAAALLDSDGAVLAHTPEWRGAGAAGATYRVRSRRLLVSTAPGAAETGPLVDSLLDALGVASLHAAGVIALQVRMLETSLRALVGRTLDGEGGSDRVVHFASAGIVARTGLEVHIDDHAAWTLRAPELAALALVQLAVNAERHGAAHAVALQQSTRAFHVRWQRRRRGGAVTTARSRGERQRWGWASRASRRTRSGAHSIHCWRRATTACRRSTSASTVWRCRSPVCAAAWWPRRRAHGTRRPDSRLARALRPTRG